MTNNKYLYSLWDLSFLMQRNLYMISKGKDIGEYGPSDVIKMILQSVRKIARDWGITSDKIIFLADRWSSDYNGYFRTAILRGEYKIDRVYITEEVVEEMKKDPSKTPEEIHEAELQAYFNKVKYITKWGLVKDLKNLGIPVLMEEGYEYDDLVYVASNVLYGKNNGKKSVIVTKDSDLMYSTSPQMDLFRMKSGKSEAKLVTYDEMYYKIPESLRNRGVTLYQYKAFLDSLGFGHNAMTVTRKAYCTNTESTILKILNGDYSDVEDVDTFNKQMLSFDVSKFPNIDKVINMINEDFPTIGKIGSLEDFHSFCSKYKIEGISDKYFSELVGDLDPNLYTKY